jgi:hypothetical protein
VLTDDEAAPLSNQTFCDIYPTDTLAIGQRIKILSLTLLFLISGDLPNSMSALATSPPSISLTSTSGCCRR